MDVEIGEMENIVQVTDTQALLDPKILERIIGEVVARLKENTAHDSRAEADRTYQKSITGER